MPTEIAPTKVDVDRERSVTLRWADAAPSTFGIEDLRAACPCAECRGLRERDLPVWPKPSSPKPLRLEDAELVGAWGVQFRWNDGHSTGIYAWDVLRRWGGVDRDDPLEDEE